MVVSPPQPRPSATSPSAMSRSFMAAFADFVSDKDLTALLSPQKGASPTHTLEQLKALNQNEQRQLLQQSQQQQPQQSQQSQQKSDIQTQQQQAQLQLQKLQQQQQRLIQQQQLQIQQEKLQQQQQKQQKHSTQQQKAVNSQVKTLQSSPALSLPQKSGSSATPNSTWSNVNSIFPNEKSPNQVSVNRIPSSNSSLKSNVSTLLPSPVSSKPSVSSQNAMQDQLYKRQYSAEDLFQNANHHGAIDKTKHKPVGKFQAGDSNKQPGPNYSNPPFSNSQNTSKSMQKATVLATSVQDLHKPGSLSPSSLLKSSQQSSLSGQYKKSPTQPGQLLQSSQTRPHQPSLTTNRSQSSPSNSRPQPQQSPTSRPQPSPTSRGSQSTLQKGGIFLSSPMMFPLPPRYSTLI